MRSLNYLYDWITQFITGDSVLPIVIKLSPCFFIYMECSPLKKNTLIVREDRFSGTLSCASFSCLRIFTVYALLEVLRYLNFT